jgi:hypothetical protein
MYVVATAVPAGAGLISTAGTRHWLGAGVAVALAAMLAAAVMGVGERGAAGDGRGSGGDGHHQAAWCAHGLQLLR